MMTEKYKLLVPHYMETDAYYSYLESVAYLFHIKEDVIKMKVDFKQDDVNIPKIVFEVALLHCVPSTHRKYFTYGGPSGEELAFQCSYLGNRKVLEDEIWNLGVLSQCEYIH